MSLVALTHVSAGSSDSNSITTGAIDTTGADLLILALSYNTTLPTISDSKGNTWTALTDSAIGADHARIYWCQPSTVGTGHTFTATVSGGFPSIAVQAFSGSKPTTPVDQQNSGSAVGATTVATGSVTPSEANELLLAAISINSATGGATASSIDSAFTLAEAVAYGAGIHLGVALGYLIETTATAKNPTFTISASSTLAAAVATFKSAAVGAALAASPGVRVSTTASLSTGSAPLAASPGIRVGFSANLFGAAALQASPGVRVGVSANLTAPATFSASPGIRFSVSAQFGAALFTAAPGIRFSTLAALSTGTEAAHAAQVRIQLAGVDARVRVSGLTIRDVANDNPNTCKLTIAYPPVVLPTYGGLVLADGASEYWPLGELTGTAVANRVAGGPGMTKAGGVTFGQPGPLADGETAMLFNATTGQLSSGAAAIPIALAFTVEGFVKTTTGTGSNGYLFYNQDSGLAGTIGFGVSPGGQPFLTGTGMTGSFAAPIVTDGAWHHLAATNDGTTTKIYVDGALVFTGASAHVAGAGVSWMGSNGGTQVLKGSLAHVALYATVLSAAQIAAHYAARTLTAAYVVPTGPPVTAQSLRVSLNLDTPRLLFNGALQDVGLSYEGKPDQLVYPASAIDDTPRANRRRPFGTWTTVSATTVAEYLVAVFAPGFTAHVQANLPPVSIILDGSEGMNGALTQIANLIGGYFFWEDGALWLFTDPAFLGTELPDDLVASTPGRFLNDPPIRVSTDASQLRTRVFGKGHGEALLAEMAANESILPVANAAAWFLPSGGHVIAGSLIFAYTGVQAGGGGSLVGPGAAPSTAPALALAAGSGLGSGVYQYGYLDGTAAGRSLVSPLSTITTGPLTPPAAPIASAPAGGSGAGADSGTHDYELTFQAGGGETVPSAISNAVTTSNTPSVPITSVPAAPSAANLFTGTGYFFAAVGDSIYYVVTYGGEGGGQTTAGPASNVVTAQVFSGGGGASINPIRVTVSGASIPAGVGFGGTVYRNVNGAWTAAYFANFGSSFTDDGTGFATSGPPGSNTAVTRATFTQRVPVTLPLGPSVVTGRKLYRRFNGTGTFKLVTTIADNTTTSYLDAIANASLGAAAPSVSTATFNQVTLTGVALGPTGTTYREIYRTAVNASQLQLLTTLANNTATTFLDTIADGALGANAPTSDTSGFAQPAGQVNAGSTSLPTASAGPFASGGGWALRSTGEAIRYTGITGNTLTGIPATGPGALLTTVKYGDAVLPAPALTGVTGNTLPLLKDTPINIWVQRDDLAAQAEQAAIDLANGVTPADGIYEAPPIVDERRNEASLIALCDATLARYSRPLVTVTYATRDVKTKSARPITIDLASPPIHQTLTIQEVTIDQIDIAPGLPPRFTVTASSDRQSLDGLLRKLLAAAA